MGERASTKGRETADDVGIRELSSPTWIGHDCPAGWRRVGSIDVADPADVSWALDRDYRIGAIFDGMSFSVAEPCAADIYEEIRCEHCDGTGDVHGIDGEWRGRCTCPAGEAQKLADANPKNPLPGEIAP